MQNLRRNFSLAIYLSASLVSNIMARSNINAITAVLKVLGGPLLFGIIIGSTGPSIDTMKNAVLDFKGNMLRLDDTNSLVVFSANEASVYSAIVAAGAMVGALLGGSIVGRCGFKYGMMLTIPVYLVAWVIMGFATGVWLLYVARSLTGFAVGLNSFAVPTYISDVAPSTLRGVLGACNQLMIAVGILCVYVIGLAFREDGGFVFSQVNPKEQIGVADPGSFCNWRRMALLNIVPTVLWAVCLVLLPESPRWKASHGDVLGAKRILRYLRGGWIPPAEEEALESLGKPHVVVVEAAVVSRKRRPSYAKQVFMGAMLQVFQQFSGINAIMFFCTTIMRNARMEQADRVSVYVMIDQVVMTLVACLLIDRLGRKALLMTSASFMALACASFGIYFLMQGGGDGDETTNVQWLVLPSILVYMGAFSLGVGPIPWLMMGEILPNEIRTTGSVIATVVNWSCAFLVILCMEPAAEWIS